MNILRNLNLQSLMCKYDTFIYYKTKVSRIALDKGSVGVLRI